MGYKLLGFLVWRGARWYLQRRYGGAPRKVFAGGVIALVLAGAIVAQRQASSNGS